MEFACQEKDADFVALLLAKDYDMTQPNKDGDGALHWACHYGDFEIIDMMLNSADPNAGEREEQRVPPAVQQQGLKDDVLEATDKLLSTGLDVQYRNKDDSTLLGQQPCAHISKVAEKLLALKIDISHHQQRGHHRGVRLRLRVDRKRRSGAAILPGARR